MSIQQTDLKLISLFFQARQYGFYDCPSDYEVLSKSADGVIKAIRHLNLPWEGWMWHPEREEEYSTEDVERLQKLVEG